MLPRILATLLALSLAARLGADATQQLWTDDNIPAPVLQKLTEAQDLALSLRYDEAEAMIRDAMPQAPDHPLCRVFLVGILLSRIQENFKNGAKEVPKPFFAEAGTLLDEAAKQHEAFPQSPYPLLYLGAGYGMRGLARLYAGNYLGSYVDGKKGAGLLKQAVAIDPGLYNAYMGLGQFEYYCGTLGGVLQFLLALPGDPVKGLAMLKTCEDKGTYAAWPCKAYRIRLLAGERNDYAAAEPELAALVSRYPGNYDFARAVFQALDAGVNTAALRSSAADILRRMDQGWSPAPYAKLDRDEMRLDLAKACISGGDKDDAAAQLKKLLAEPDPWRARAEALLNTL